MIGEIPMKYETVQDRLSRDDWRVEAVDCEDEGKVYVAIFTGPQAKERAEEYASWKSNASRPAKKETAAAK